MLCLSRTAGAWSNEIVPPLMARLAKIRLRPVIRLVAENVPRRPVMILRSLSVTDLAKEWRGLWAYVGRVDSAGFDNLSFYEVLRPGSAVETYKWVFVGAAGISVVANEPALGLPAFFAWIFRIVDFIFPRGIGHEELPILR